jgi:hypothetical protein
MSLSGPNDVTPHTPTLERAIYVVSLAKEELDASNRLWPAVH